MRSSSPPIAITAVGSISAQGHDGACVEANYQRGGSRLRAHDIGGTRVAAGAVPEHSEAALKEFLDRHPRYEALDRTAKLALFAADHAWRAAGWPRNETMGVVVGSSRGATGLFEKYHAGFIAAKGRKTAPLTSPTTTLGNLSSWIAQHVSSRGPATEMSSTCSTSIYALGTAAAWLRSGMATRFLAGGTEAPLTPFTVAQMRALRVYARDADDAFPCRSCFLGAGATNTMVLGEGACVIALESLCGEGGVAGQSASERLSLGLILGMGFAVEPITTETSLSEEGLALRLSMQRALADAGLDTVDALVTHTPGTALGDRAELNAVRALFQNRLPILTSNKWILGHTLGASGALGIEYALGILRSQRWVEYPYPTPFSNEPRDIGTVMVNSVGFGGNAGSVIVSLPS